MSAALAGAGAAAQVVGSVIQMIAARRANEELRQAFDTEIEQQNAFRNQAFSAHQQRLPSLGVETAREQIGAGQRNRQGAYERINTAPLGFGGQKQTNRDKAQYSMRGEARGKLGGYQDWQLDQAIARIRTQDELNKISSFSGGQAQVFPYLMQDAQHSQDSLAAIGQIIGAIGGSATSFGSLYGGGGGGGGGGGAFRLPAAPAANVGFDGGAGKNVSNQV